MSEVDVNKLKDPFVWLEPITRQCGVGESRDEHLTSHNDLRVRGKLVDNRWSPPGGKPGELEGLDSTTGKPTTATPLYQTVQGHGLGTQFYPPIGFALMLSVWKCSVKSVWLN